MKSNYIYFIIGLGLFLRLIIAFYNPIFNAPDEKAHFHYIEYISKNHLLPVSSFKSSMPSEESAFTYPPVYYLVLLPFYIIANKLFPISVYYLVLSLRMLSIVIWLLNMFFSIKIFKQLKINNNFICIFVLCMLSFLPTYVFISSSINPDNLMVLWGTIIIFILCKKNSFKNSMFIGITIALSLVTKLTGWFLISFLLLYLLLLLFKKRIKLLSFISILFPTLIFSLLFYLPFVLRNYQIYHSYTAMGSVSLFKPAYLFLVSRALWYFNVTFWASSGRYNNIIFLPFLSKWLSILIISVFIHALVFKRRIFKKLLYRDGDILLLSSLICILIASSFFIYTGIRYATIGGPGGQGRYLYIFLFPMALLSALGFKSIISNPKDKLFSKISVFLFCLYSISFTYYSLINFIH